MALVRKILFAVGLWGCFSSLLLRNRLCLPKGLWGPKGLLILLILSLPGIVQSRSWGCSKAYLTSLFSGFLLAWCFFNLEQSGLNTRTVFYRSFIMILTLSFFITMGSQINLLDIHWYLQHFMAVSFVTTTWSHIAALALPIPIFFFVHGPPSGKSLRPLITCLLPVWGIFLSQVSLASRGGILASLVTLSLSLFIAPLSKFMRCLLVIGCLLILFFYPKNHSDHWHLNRLGDLDHFSTHRIFGIFCSSG